MCGIAGFVGHLQNPARAADRLRGMCDVIRHRGPDEAGYRVDGGAALGMRRLSIIDLAGGSQPIGNEDGSIQVVFNGEIYNYRELRDALVRRGHRFSTDTDTETIVHLYEEHGERLVHKLRGMFAFALWDGRRQRLVMARDRLGIKPLHYARRNDGLAFASELKSLVELDPSISAVDPRAIARYLALGYVPDPECAIEGVEKLRPGHLLVWEPKVPIRVERYWTPVRDPATPEISIPEAIEEIRRLLAEAVRYRLIADVPLGACLSGGLDSTSVVAEMGRQMDRPVRTFSIGFEEQEFNEAPDAAAIAKALGTDHTELVVRPDVDVMLEEIVAAFDEPFADSSAVPTLMVSRLAARHVKVVLSGDGGDELFGGYTRYRDLIRRSRVLPPAAGWMLGRLARRLPQGARGRNRLLELSRSARGRYVGMVANPLHVVEGGVARPEIAALAGPTEAMLDTWFEEAALHPGPARPLAVDLLSYLPGDILTKVDRMSMLASIEARVPLLDHRLVEFAAGLPLEWKIREGTGKWIFREAMRGLVPDFVFRKRKQGFGVPIRLWLNGELRHRVEALRDAGSAIFDYVEPGALHRVIGEHRTGRRDHSALLWKLIVLDVWLRGRSVRASTPSLATVA